MPKQPPEVLTGLRDPQDVRMERAKEREASGARVSRPVLSDPSFTIYESMYPGYRIQITSPDEIKDPFTGRISRAKPLVAQFDNGRWVNSYKDPKTRAMVDKILQSNDFYGLDGGHFWLKADADVRDQAIAKENTRRTLAALPKEEIRAMFQQLVESGELDLELPTRTGSKVPPEIGSETTEVTEPASQS